MMNTSSGSHGPAQEIAQDTLVCDVSGEKVGHVSFSALRDGFFVVEQGWLFTHQLYLPTTAILARDSDRITLRLSKQELKDDRWKQPPEGDVSDVSVPRETFPNSPLPASGPAEDRAEPILPPAGVRPLPGEPADLHAPEPEGGERLLAPDEQR